MLPQKSPMRRRHAGNRRAERDEVRTQDRAQVRGAQIRSGKRKTRDIAERAVVVLVHQRADELALRICRNGACHVVGLVVLHDGLHPAILSHPDQPVRDDAGDPRPALDVEGEAVGIVARPELCDDFLARQAAVAREAEARDPLRPRLVEIHVGAGRIDAALVGPHDAAARDARAALVHERDEAVIACRAELVVGLVHGADRNPHAVLIIEQYEIRARQRDAVDLEQERLDLPVAVQPPHTPFPAVAAVGDEKRAVAQHREAVRMQLPTARDLADNQLLRAVGTDVHDAAARIAGEEIAGGGCQHAFGPVESGARAREFGQLQLKVVHGFLSWRVCATIKSFAAPCHAELS